MGRTVRRRQALRWLAAATAPRLVAPVSLLPLLPPVPALAHGDGAPQHDPQRLAWLAEGEAALARGDTEAATRAFEAAASRLHSADSELGGVRAALQAGRYREALGFAAHTAGAHRDTADGSAVYAWLLALVGQRALAQRMLQQRDAGERGDGGQALLDATAQALAQPLPQARGPLLTPPHRMAPASWGHWPAQARPAGTGVLLPSGVEALVPHAALGSAATGWVRNGLGQAVAAQPEGTAEAGWARLRLAMPLAPAAATPGAGAAPWSARLPFAGSPGAVLAYADDAGWPWLFEGFVGRQGLLGLPLPAQAGSGVLFDAGGRVSALVLRGDDGVHRLQRPAAIPGSEAVAPRLWADAVYERALTTVLQLLLPA